MRHALLAAALAVMLGVGWMAVTGVCGAEGQKVAAPAAAAPPTGQVRDVVLASATVPPTPVRPIPTSTAARGLEAVTPPKPLPDFEIPPIPEVKKDEPFKAGPMPVRTAPPDVFEEGKRLFNREGVLQMDPLGRSMFAFNSGDKPMYLLENSWREYLEKVTEQGTKQARWRVSGLITVYGGRNYLLLTKIVHVLPEEENR